MILLACVDDNFGMLFNHRRQSQDRALREYMASRTAGHKLWMNSYSRKQFDDTAQILVDDDFLDKAGPGDYCFVENTPILPHASRIERIILYRWNRVYPSDVSFDLPLTGWTLTETNEFPGSSHKKITEEIYTHEL